MNSQEGVYGTTKAERVPIRVSTIMTPDLSTFEVASPPAQVSWYVLQVRHKSEFLVAAHLAQRNFPFLIPAKDVLSKWTDRTVTLRMPLFPGYVFCQFDAASPANILSIPRVCSVISRARIFSAVEETEIVALQQLDKSGTPVGTVSTLHEGERVRVIAGPLIGVEGYIEKMKPNTFFLRVRLLERAVSLQVPWTSLERL